MVIHLFKRLLIRVLRKDWRESAEATAVQVNQSDSRMRVVRLNIYIYIFWDEIDSTC